MWLILSLLPVLIVLSCSSQTHAQKPESKSKDPRTKAAAPAHGEIKKRLGIVEGKYQLKKPSSDQCLEGQLEIVKLDGNKISVLVGGRLLLSDFGSEKQAVRTSEDGCVTTQITTPSQKLVHQEIKVRCAIEHKGYQLDRKVVFRPKQVKYQIDYVSHDGKTRKTAECELNR